MKPDSFVYMAYAPDTDGNIGSEIQIDKKEKPSLEAIVERVRITYGDEEARKVPQIFDAANYMRKWYNYFSQNGELKNFSNYLKRNNLSMVEPVTFSACTSLDEKIRAYSTQVLQKKYSKAKLESIGIPADYENRVLKDEKMLGLSRKQVMHFYLEHEMLHMALEHEPGYSSDLDYVVKEGDVAKHMFNHFKEELEKSGNKYYEPLMRLAARQYVEHSIVKAHIIKDASILYSNDVLDAAMESNTIIPLAVMASNIKNIHIN